MKGTKFLLKVILGFAFVFVLFFILNNKALAAQQNENEEFYYLSDLQYHSDSSVGWGSITLDKNLDSKFNNGLITLIVNGEEKKFFKGISAHANSQVIFDVSQYDYFSTYYGVDASRGTIGTAVWFKFCTKKDEDSSWVQEGENSPDKKGNSEAGFVTIDVRGKKYLKLEAYGRRGIDSAHSCYGDAKVWKEGYKPGEEVKADFIKTVEQYDEELKKFDGKEIIGEYEKILLRREFVNNVGYDLLQFLANYKASYNDTLKWLINGDDFKDGTADDLENLRLYILGGKPDGGSYKSSIDELVRLYVTYKKDFKDTTPTNNKWYPKLTKGDVYKKMAISLSLTHSTAVGYWAQINHPSNRSDSLERYRIYKYLYDNGKFVVSSRQDHTPWFEALQVEEMRYVMNNITDDEELIWLNEYTQKRIDANPNQEEKYLQPHTYIAYVWPNFENPIFHDPEKKDYWDNVFEGIFSKYGVTYSTPDNHVYKAWMSMRNEYGTGAVCGGISKLGTHIRAAHGTPASVIGQPGHAAIIYYRKDANGNGYWTIDNDINGWSQSGKTEKLGTRMPLGWGNDSYVSGYAASYIALSQEALNHNEDYEKSEKLIMVANLHNNDASKKEQYLREALKVLPYNVDAWWELIKLYQADENTTEAKYFALAEEIAEALKAFPLPMYNLTNLLKNNLTSNEYSFAFSLLQTRILNEGKNATSETMNVYQPSITKAVASYLLGQMDSALATFSFDGEEAGKIIISNRYDGNGVRWDYSLDGKQTWKEVSFSADEAHKWQLKPEEIAKITAENDIYVHIVGANYEEKNLYKIDILDSAGLPNTLYANDLENRMIASVPEMEWKLNETDEWNSYRVLEPDLTGDKKIFVRMSATGTHLAGETVEYQFTQDEENNKRKYIPIAHLEIADYSTQSKDSGRPFYAPNAIDGNVNTLWHTDFAQNVLQQPIKPFISIKLDEPKNISALEFTQRKYPGKPGDPDNIKNARVYVSMDGESWTQAGSIENCNVYGDLYAVNFELPAYGQYVKIEMDTTNMFASLAMVNLYEDITVVTLGTFSFDGPNAGKIMILDDFKDARWEYSLDGGTTWKNGNKQQHQLTVGEIAQINVDNKIKIRLNNMESTIEIQNQEIPVITAYLNDLENRLIGINDVSKLEWRIQNDNGNWTSYEEKEPIVTGDTKLLIRKKANGMLMASEPVEFTFTEDNQPVTAKYVPIKHITSANASNTTVPSRGEEAQFAIDGLPTTMWHSSRTTTTMHDPRWIVLELDEPRYISKIEYVRKAGYAYGIPKDGVVSVSMDGENWIEVLKFENLYNVTTPAELTNTADRKELELSKIEKAKYVKMECTKSCDSVHGDRDGQPMDYFFSAAMINLFEDTSKVTIPTADIEYNITELTNQNVTATLVNKSTDITVTNNGGKDTYTFTDNGNFTFEFVDKKGTKGTATATVDWICKTLPTPTITYTPNSLTNQDVTANVTFDRDNVKIVNEANEVMETITKGNSYVYTFTENGAHEIRFIGPYGNAGKTTATVNWIDKKAPIATIKYSSTNLSNQDVTATVTFDEENVTVKEGNTHTFTENGEYTFEFEDAAGNIGSAVAKVTWIDKNLPTATITYSTEELTNQDVTATVSFDKDGVKIVDDQGKEIEGGEKYIFTDNGSHEFNFVGPSGNKGVAVAKVDWIDKVEPVGIIEYSITKLTNQSVTATIKFEEEDVQITNNDGKNTYTFEMNGEFEFEFVDKAGNKGTAKAEVEWIDKREINATITYDINDITNQDVTATITFDKENVTVEGGNTHTFTENGRHEFKFVGPAGNTGTAVAEVTWIDKTPPVATIIYDITNPTNQDVTAKVTFDEGGVTIINDKGEEIINGDTYVFTKNGSYTFRYIGPLGNIGTAVATVDWIDKTFPIAEIEYSTREETNQDVIAKLVNASEEIIITNNNGSDTYIFTQNGEFTFEFEDKVGNKGTAIARVDWIKDTPEGPENPEKPDDYKIGDINQDGKRTATDILAVKRHLVAGEKQDWILIGVKFKAGDINQDGNITATDLLLIKRLVLSEMKE